MSQQEEKKPDFDKIYGISAKGNYKIIDDSLVYPHPYCIGTKLVGWASDHHMGILGDAAIEDAEEHGIRCEWRDDEGKCERKYEEHERSLTIKCKQRITTGKVLKDGKKKTTKEFHEWIEKVKPIAKKNGFLGFAFVGVDGKGLKEL